MWPDTIIGDTSTIFFLYALLGAIGYYLAKTQKEPLAEQEAGEDGTEGFEMTNPMGEEKEAPKVFTELQVRDMIRESLTAHGLIKDSTDTGDGDLISQDEQAEKHDEDWAPPSPPSGCGDGDSTQVMRHDATGKAAQASV